MDRKQRIVRLREAVEARGALIKNVVVGITKVHETGASIVVISEY